MRVFRVNLFCLVEDFCFIFDSMKTSIRNKILRLNLLGLFLCALCVGGFGILCANSFIEGDTEERLKLLSEKESRHIETRFNSIEQYVNTMSHVVGDGLENLEHLKDTARQEAFTRQNLSFIRSTIPNIQGAVAVYLRYNPTFTPPTSGVFMAKTSKRGGIQKLAPTDFSKYDPEDIEHVGWYYVPITSGKPLWMEPYENKNIDVRMISYVVPLFKFGEEIGVVGVDVDFDDLSQEISRIKVLKSGFAYLERGDGKVAYHPDLSAGDVVKLSDDDVYFRHSLPNGMRLVIAVPRAEVSEMRNVLVIQIVCFTFFIMVLFFVVSVLQARSITRPLYALTKAAKDMTAGNMEISFETDAQDEIGELSRSFENALNYIKEYLGYVHGIAYKDSLTGVRNKAAYDKYSMELQKKVEYGVVSQYGIIVFDVNNLKKVNDCYGHERGNTLLVNACRIICRTFVKSPVFRIGGDEFVVVLHFVDMENYVNLLQTIDEKMRDSAKSATDPWDAVSMAYGVAFYKGTHNEKLMEVFNRADKNMYAMKKEMKQGRDSGK
mgnify:CR=1 FL=1